MLAAADFGKQVGVRSDVDTQQPAFDVLLRVVLIHAIDGELVDGLRAFAYQPHYFGDRITNGSNFVDPEFEILPTTIVGLTQPVAVLRQIKFAGTARDGAAVLDRVQKLTVFQ